MHTFLEGLAFEYSQYCGAFGSDMSGWVRSMGLNLLGRIQVFIRWTDMIIKLT